MALHCQVVPPAATEGWEVDFSAVAVMMVMIGAAAGSLRAGELRGGCGFIIGTDGIWAGMGVFGLSVGVAPSASPHIATASPAVHQAFWVSGLCMFFIVPAVFEAVCAIS
ncbi:MAG TPA: hypothetical protein VJS66_02200, partial [Burkholderiales bacterium]|nr:hypothetical protein [Burkholderiales bacterium]